MCHAEINPYGNHGNRCVTHSLGLSDKWNKAYVVVVPPHTLCWRTTQIYMIGCAENSQIYIRQRGDDCVPPMPAMRSRSDYFQNRVSISTNKLDFLWSFCYVSTSIHRLKISTRLSGLHVHNFQLLKLVYYRTRSVRILCTAHLRSETSHSYALALAHKIMSWYKAWKLKRKLRKAKSIRIYKTN